MDISGERYGSLVAIRRSDHQKTNTRWLFRCDCGSEVDRYMSVVRAGQIHNCGCLTERPNLKNIYRSPRSGKPSRERESWRHARARCHNPKDKDFATYGGLGIVMCDRWRNDFAVFLADVGPSPAGFTLDRIDPAGNYEPGNCRWADRKTQAVNRRRARWVELPDGPKPLSDTARKYDVHPGCLWRRVRAGEPTLQAIAAMRATKAPSIQR